MAILSERTAPEDRAVRRFQALVMEGSFGAGILNLQKLEKVGISADLRYGC